MQQVIASSDVASTLSQLTDAPSSVLRPVPTIFNGCLDRLAVVARPMKPDAPMTNAVAAVIAAADDSAVAGSSRFGSAVMSRDARQHLMTSSLDSTEFPPVRTRG